MPLKSKLIITISAIIALSAGFWLSTLQERISQDQIDEAKKQSLAEARKNYSPIQGSILTPARKIVVPDLVKDDNSTFNLDDLTGDWHLLFFGYTNCPDICPVTMGVTAQAKKIAEESGKQFPQVVFISVDPERDKVDMLADYVQYFDKDFIGVTGDADMIKALTLQMSVVYMKMTEENSDGDYLVDHSSALLLLNPEGKLVAFLNPPHDPNTIYKDFQTVIGL